MWERGPAPLAPPQELSAHSPESSQQQEGRALHGLEHVISPWALEAPGWQPQTSCSLCPRQILLAAEVQRLPALNLDGGGEQKVLGDGAQPHPVPGGAVRHLARLGLLTWARQLAGGSGTLDHS